MTPELIGFDAFRDYCDALEAGGLARGAFRWGITKAAVMRGLGRPAEEIRDTETDTVMKRHVLPDGGTLWDVDLHSPDLSDGIPYYSAYFILAPQALVQRGVAIDAWLDDNRDAYELFTRIKWSAAPDEARKALEWLQAHGERCFA